MLSSEIRFVFELGVLIVFTRMGGYWLRRWLRLPGVIGELLVGMAIGPYALDGLEPGCWQPASPPSPVPHHRKK